MTAIVGARLPIGGLLAHQGGWDEIALVAGPMVVIAGLLVLAKRRVDGAAQQRGRRSDPPADRP